MNNKVHETSRTGHVPAVEMHTGFHCILFELLEGTSTECIGANKSRFPSFPLEHETNEISYKDAANRTNLIVMRNLRNCCSFTGTLQTNKHKHIRLTTLRLIWLCAAIKHIAQLIKYRSLQKTTLVNSTSKLLGSHSFLNVLTQIGNKLYINISLQQC